MKPLLQQVAASLGITTVCLLWVVGPLVDPSHSLIYHWSGSPSAVFLPVLLDFLGCWSLLALLLLIAQRTPRLQLLLWTCILVFLPWIVFRNAISLFGVNVSPWTNRIFFALSLLTLLVLLTRYRPMLTASFPRLHPLLLTVFSFAAIIGLSLLGQLFWFAHQARGLNSNLSTRPRLQVHRAVSPQPRIIWILFDELSYQQVYEQRYPGLQLPAFDRLAAQSTVFTHVAPAGILTVKVLPSLIMGERIDRIRSSASGQLSTHSPTGDWKSFDQHQTVFQDALDAGYSTGIAGWYNPYCRILPDVLDRCFWVFSQPATNHMSPGLSAEKNLRAPFTVLGAQPNQWHIQDLRDLSREADSLLQDSSLSFVLLHLPVPHPDGIYNRATGEFATTGASYIDNLALADRCLAHIRDLLQASGAWDNSTIVLMGDHSWRMRLLTPRSPGWTREDQLASHGEHFDDRPAYLVKLPQQSTPARIDSTFDAVRTRHLLDALMHHQINTPEALTSWAR